MNFKNFTFSIIFLAISIAATADEPVGAVQSESVNQSSNSVSSFDQTMEARSVGGIEEVVVTAQKREEKLFSKQKRNLKTFLKKSHRTITHHHVSQFVRCSSDGNSHAVKCTRDVENTR